MSRSSKSRKTNAESRARYYIRQEANKRGWNIAHVSRGGDFLEENEIEAYFPNIGLSGTKPDFLICFNHEPLIIVEAKNEPSKIDQAIREAIEYAEAINSTQKYNIKFAVGAAGQEDTGFIVGVKYKTNDGWFTLTSSQQELTTIPSKKEVELAILADNGTTNVSVPAAAEFVDAAIEISIILRAAKVEASLRPKVIGAITLAMYQGKVDLKKESTLTSINNLSSQAINDSYDISKDKKNKLIDALHLSGTDFDRLSPYIGRIVSILLRLNVRSVLQTDVDFLGMFYEAFLRYGYDNNALGIVFTPRHITKFCADLLEVSYKDKVIDIACGTGGFLVAAFDRMLNTAESEAAIIQAKSALYGFDTNPTVWLLAMLNMFFRGDGKSNIELGSAFEEDNINPIKKRFTKAFLNPPFSQKDEPEYKFIDISMECLGVGEMLASVVYAGVFADNDHKAWRKEFLRKHSLLGIISLPEDLFYPTSAPTSIIIARAHIPQTNDGKILMSRVWNDGFEKLKNRRVEREGSQLPLVKQAFNKILNNQIENNKIATTILGSDIKNGTEWSPQHWLPQSEMNQAEIINYRQNIKKSIFQSVSYFPDLSAEALENFCDNWQNLPELPTEKEAAINFFFKVLSGKSTGGKDYTEGTTPYISSGENCNSIIRLIEKNDEECFIDGGITVTAFGYAAVQPWQFMARGNGGSAVRVLIPKFNMSFDELVWFAAQINSQKWRFFYARMAIKSRLEDLIVNSPKSRILNKTRKVAEDIREFSQMFDDFSSVS
ncbi:N-6 DNA methylase [Cronbergia sp. UHCC 0137]|uniref:HsdM family class I SAM-dependent methyltransferase n=1 Tax=Cronbergia sp. UHCC 0137 TaxID=3110239 RepID=UPI002B2008FB|nr:N-6 DNA methylase [Cronbergia sp. UHCC 0137]MEA5620608.1 N-6 DNA methylase [Cronbergia sp. UHCC 0137]